MFCAALALILLFENGLSTVPLLAALVTLSLTSIIGTALAGIPVSTTHAITGAILGVGTVKGVRSVRWIWGQRIVVAWILTIPCAAFVAAVSYLLIHWTVQPFFK